MAEKAKSDQNPVHPEQLRFKAPKKPSGQPWADKATYERMYEASIREPDAFWAKQAEQLKWHKKWDKVSSGGFSGDHQFRWFEGGKINVSENCIDRHIEKNGDTVAILWEPDSPNEKAQHITYRELHTQVSRLANALKANGVKKGDRVVIYLPMIPEAAYAMLACARIGAVHSVVFGGFAPDSIKGRLNDTGASFVITADEGLRGGKSVPLKANLDKALKDNQTISHVMVVKRTGGKIDWKEGRDFWYHDAVATADETCKPESMDAEDPLFILYTSGSASKPKGMLHTTAGYLLYASLTHQYIFDYHPGDIYWCTADVGWITGHTYVVYGPLANGATTLMFEGVPNYPDFSRFWDIIDKHKVNSFYTAPTAIRSLMGQGDAFVTKTSRKSLRVLGSVGEPINPEAWMWYHEVVGNKTCPIVDTWWQTETGGILITPLPYATDLKPGSATLPFFGVKPAIVDNDGKEITGEGEGNLCISASWPGQARSIYGDHKRFIETYFSSFKGKYFSSDGARRDKDGYYWITGRMDDVIKVSGHRLGSAEIESALVANHHVTEAAVVGIPLTLRAGQTGDEALRKELVQWVRNQIGPIATPEFIQFTPALPKTRSGKIMRRILRKIATNDYADLGDTNTLTNPEAVEELIQNRLNR
ncbi:MAG: acetate--CoA ligase [Proteobacteria bacterium]|nr:acetate--CoA ligase [Pseudomonadota bacterium]